MHCMVAELKVHGYIMLSISYVEYAHVLSPAPFYMGTKEEI